MVEEGRFFYEDGKRLINEWVDGKVKTFVEASGRRYTEISFAGKTITVAREMLPRIVPRTYGEIIIPVLGEEGEPMEEKLPIKRAVIESPFFIVETRTGILGSVQGRRLDLALAYGLGVIDEDLVKDLLDTKMDPRISEQVEQRLILGQIVF